MRYLGKAPELDNPETYDASFLMANQRVRGVGYEAIGRRRFRFKKSVPRAIVTALRSSMTARSGVSLTKSCTPARPSR